MEQSQGISEQELQTRLGMAIEIKNGPWAAELMGLGARPTSRHMAKAWLHGEVAMVVLLSKGAPPFDESCAVAALKREDLGRLGKAALALAASVKPTAMPAMQAALESCQGSDPNRVALGKMLLANADPRMRQLAVGQAAHMGLPDAIAALAALGVDPNAEIPQRVARPGSTPLVPLEVCLLAASDAGSSSKDVGAWERSALALIACGARPFCRPIEGDINAMRWRVMGADPSAQSLIDACGRLNMPELAMECARRLDFSQELREVAERHPTLAALAEKLSLAESLGEASQSQASVGKRPRKSL